MSRATNARYISRLVWRRRRYQWKAFFRAPKDGTTILRRDLLSGLAAAGLGFILPGCRGTQYARVIKPGEREMIGSHQAGQETFRPLVDEAVTKLVARHAAPPHMLVSAGPEPLPPRSEERRV